jgi:hypothetical protein
LLRALPAPTHTAFRNTPSEAWFRGTEMHLRWTGVLNGGQAKRVPFTPPA